jgi:hypothetical protein
LRDVVACYVYDSRFVDAPDARYAIWNGVAYTLAGIMVRAVCGGGGLGALCNGKPDVVKAATGADGVYWLSDLPGWLARASPAISRAFLMPNSTLPPVRACRASLEHQHNPILIHYSRSTL